MNDATPITPVVDLAARRAKARRIVRRAAERVNDPAVKDWIFCDERGTFERLAMTLCDRPALACPAPTEPINAPKDDEEEAIAVAVALAALEARIRNIMAGQLATR